MNSLPDSCWALRVSHEFSAWLVYRARAGPGPGPSALDGRLQKKRVLEETDMLYIRQNTMFEQISTISTISMILSPDECSPKCPSPSIYTHPPLNCYSRTKRRGTFNRRATCPQMRTLSKDYHTFNRWEDFQTIRILSKDDRAFNRWEYFRRMIRLSTAGKTCKTDENTFNIC